MEELTSIFGAPQRVPQTLTQTGSSIWTPPEVTAPTEVTINVTVHCLETSCMASNGIKLMVNPRPIGQISLEKLFDGDPDNVKLGDIVSYTININNTGETNVTFLPLVDNYPNAFLSLLARIKQWNLGQWIDLELEQPSECTSSSRPFD